MSRVPVQIFPMNWTACSPALRFPALTFWLDTNSGGSTSVCSPLAIANNSRAWCWLIQYTRTCTTVRHLEAGLLRPLSRTSEAILDTFEHQLTLPDDGLSEGSPLDGLNKTCHKSASGRSH
jgi:hypothetical protein